MNKKALITGITGQDGSYLAELLIQKNYHVIGFLRKSSKHKVENKNPLWDRVEFAYGDLSDSVSLANVLRKHQPDEIYNLAAQSHAGESWQNSVETSEVTGLGAHRLFEAVRKEKPDARVFEASSSEMFGRAHESPQNERTACNPVSPYGVAKYYAHSMARIYRERFGIFIACGILFNHESPRRGMHFLSQKVAYGAACIKKGILNSPMLNERSEPIVKEGKIALGSLDAKKDWGFAPDYIEAMWRMLQQEKPDDFIVGTGDVRTVKDFCQEAFSYVGLRWEEYVQVDSRFVRPAETGPLVADASKAEKTLSWKPKTSFKQMVDMMVEYHLQQLT